MTSRITPGALLAAVALAAAIPSFARAQANPTSDQIIQSLTPPRLVGGTRGIRPSVSGTPAATATSAAPPTAGQPPREAMAGSRPGASSAQQAAAAPSVNLTLEFRTGSADLTPPATRALDELGRALSSNQLASYRFRIEGHTDTVGTPEVNKALSERRAAAVVDYLAAKYGVARTRLEAVGMGEEGLLVATPAQTSEPRNRRVQVVNLSA